MPALQATDFRWVVVSGNCGTSAVWNTSKASDPVVKVPLKGAPVTGLTNPAVLSTGFSTVAVTE